MSTAKKEALSLIEELFKENAKGYITYEKLVKFLDKAPTAAIAKKLESLAKENKVQLITSAEIAKMRNIEDAKKRREELAKLADDNLEEEFDLASETDLLEWSRSDSPVRMYLREMGQIALLTKEEEVEISKKIELGEDIIIDAFCSVPYLIDFILDYKEPLINRERRVKELFRSFDDEGEEGSEEVEEEEENEEVEDDVEEGEEKEAKPKKHNKKDDKRAEKVIESFKALEKAKKEWLKTANKQNEVETEDEFLAKITLAFKKKILKDKLMDLGPTSKLITEIVKSMET
ncbi:MAG: RNA polymerase sigma factor RpoD, partial [Campylobacter sp.]